MRPNPARKKCLFAATFVVALIVAPAFVILYPPSTNVVSAEVYSNEVGFIKVDTVASGVVLASVPLVLLGDSPHYGLNNATLDGPGGDIECVGPRIRLSGQDAETPFPGNRRNSVLFDLSGCAVVQQGLAAETGQDRGE